jgi:hypothetical protein
MRNNQDELLQRIRHFGGNKDPSRDKTFEEALLIDAA